MKFVKFDEEISKTAANHNLKVFLDEFMSSNIKLAKVEFKEGEYKSVNVAVSCLRNSSYRHGFPIKFFKRKNDIYMERQDI